MMDLDVGSDDYMSSKQGLGDVFEHDAFDEALNECLGCSKCWCYDCARSRPCPQHPVEITMTSFEMIKAGFLHLTKQYCDMGEQIKSLCVLITVMEDEMKSD